MNASQTLGSWAVALLAGSTVCLYSAGSWAQAPTETVAEVPAYPPCEAGPPDEQTTAAAKGAFQAGNASFNEADYDRAITYWEDAYRRDCTAHAMLKNLARAYELDGQIPRAIVALETYLERSPDSGEDAAIQARIDNLEAKLKPQEPIPTAPAPAAPSVGDEPSILSQKEEFPPEPQSYKRPLTPLVLTGAGAAIGVVGAIFWTGANADLSDASDACGPTRECPTKAEQDAGNDARSKIVAWGVVSGAGAALAAGGLIWYFTQSPEPNENGFTAGVGPGFAGVNYRGSF